MQENNEKIRIDEDGKASDMASSAIMSGDGCNPVNRDSEMERAHSKDDMIFPGVIPGTLPGGVPDSLSGTIPPAFFPGARPFSG